MTRGGIVGALGVVLAWASIAGAQRAPLVLTIESGDPAVRPAAVRRALATQLGRQVLGLGQAQGGEVHVVVTLGAVGPASAVVYEGGRGARAFELARGEGDGWIVTRLAAALGETERPPGALRSWSGRPVPRSERRVLRPWPRGVGEPIGRYCVERQWIEATEEVGAVLTAPSPRRARRARVAR